MYIHICIYIYPYFQTFKLLYIENSVLSNGFEYLRL